MSIQLREADRTGFFSCALFEKIKAYLHSAGKDDPPVIGTTENFCEDDPTREKVKIGMVAKTKPPKITKDISMEKALSGTHAPGAADLVNKLLKDESDDD